MSTLIVANFGGPRSVEEIPEFLTTLLTDVDVLRSPFPRFIEKWFFRKLALKRSKTAVHDYQLIGGKSPLFEDTEWIGEQLRQRLEMPVIVFHRYLPETHRQFLRQMAESESEDFLVLPLYPQFSFATTGSIARFFSKNMKSRADQLRWIKSYCLNDHYVAAMQKCIADFLQQQNLDQKEVVLFFSAHGLPQSYVDEGDPYERECHLSFDAIKQSFPEAHSLLAFQSQFGPGEWLRPYTNELCEIPGTWNQGRKNIVFIPLSFTSDHIETLFEVEYQYLPAIRKQGLNAFRCPALNRRQDWVDALVEIAKTPNHFMNQALIRA